MFENNNHDKNDPYESYRTAYSSLSVSEPAKKHHSQFLTKKAAAISMALCVVTSAGMGIGGGILAYNLAKGTTSSQSTATASSIALQTVAASTASTSSSTYTGNTLTVAEIASVAANSVVEITTEVVTTSNMMQQYISEGAGSGVVATADGYIITNNHVIEGASKITVTLKSGESYSATLVGTDTKSDVALLKIDASNLQPAVMGDSSSLQVGETAVAIGNPLGQLGGTVTDGIISALDRQITLEDETMTLLQTNAAINPGNSGGGLFNAKGELIGLVVAKTSETGVEGLGFAIPVNKVKSVVEELSAYGYVRGRIDLTMSLVDINSSQMAMMYRVSQMGVYVLKVDSNSNAEKAGFRSGDCITAVNGTAVSTSAEIDQLLENNKVGDTVSITVKRSQQSLTLSLQLSEEVPTTSSKAQTTTSTSNGSRSLYGF